MSNNANKPAMPIIDDKISTYETEIHHGLTKREMIAMHVMQGLLSSMGEGCLYVDCARVAVTYADALLKELDNER